MQMHGRRIVKVKIVIHADPRERLVMSNPGERITAGEKMMKRIAVLASGTGFKFPGNH